MSLENQIKSDMKEALKAGQKERLLTIRSVLSQIKDEWIKKREELTEQEVIGVLMRAVKSRKDSLEMYKQGNRPDLAQKEQSELDLIQTYLPEQMSDADVKKEIAAIVDSVGASDMKDIGKVMGAAMARLKGKADGKLVQQIAKSLLS